MYATIFQPAPNAVQSGSFGNDKWAIEFPRDYKSNIKSSIDPLTGSTGSSDMMRKVYLDFDTKESAISYAKSKGIAFKVLERSVHIPKGRSYGDNFAFDRKFPWTH